MKIASQLYKKDELNKILDNSGLPGDKCQLVIGFGSKAILEDEKTFNNLRTKFPNAEIAICSTAGEIFGADALDDTFSLTAIQFEKTGIESAMVNIGDFKSSFEAGAALINKLAQTDLSYVFVLSDGATVNGSELVKGIEQVIQNKVPVTGGLAGDGTKFNSTLVGLNAHAGHGNILAIGFYGKNIKISHGSLDGWDTFGLEKTVTKSSSNKLFEIDQKNALDIYKQYLGRYADELPGSALLFPLSVKLPNSVAPVVRTILSIDKESNSMIFAGDVPEGSKVRFMKADFDRIIDAASGAAQRTLSFNETNTPKLAILISCVGRKLILGKRIEEEIEAVIDTVGKNTLITGFYSYGEISPMNQNSKCELHNQTMTITTFDEIV